MSTILERLQYGFDRASRRTWRRRARTTGEDQAYAYDGLSQVVNAARGNLNLNATAISGVPAEDEAWAYDPTGNWHGYQTRTSGSLALDQHRVHDRGNRLTQIEGAPSPILLDRAGRMRQVSPDAAGNWNQSQKITWDAWNRVVRIEQNGIAKGHYTYDGLTRRLTREVGGVTWHSYYSDAWRPLEERRDNQTVPARHYSWGARHRDDLVRQDRARTSGGPLDETRYVLMDYFSPLAITDETGAVKERYAFSAFGLRRIVSPTFENRTNSECEFTFAFQGQLLDTESGFLNYGYRSYSPHLGRWLFKDPIGEQGGMNLYGYVANNPISALDLLGLASPCPYGMCPACDPETGQSICINCDNNPMPKRGRRGRGGEGGSDGGGDFVEQSFGFGLLSITLTRDANGWLYGGIGFDIGMSMSPISYNISQYRMRGSNQEQDIVDFVTGPSMTLTSSIGRSKSMAVNPDNSVAFGKGYGAPAFGLGWSYTFRPSRE